MWTRQWFVIVLCLDTCGKWLRWCTALDIFRLYFVTLSMVTIKKISRLVSPERFHSWTQLHCFVFSAAPTIYPCHIVSSVGSEWIELDLSAVKVVLRGKLMRVWIQMFCLSEKVLERTQVLKTGIRKLYKRQGGIMRAPPSRRDARRCGLQIGWVPSTLQTTCLQYSGYPKKKGFPNKRVLHHYLE